MVKGSEYRISDIELQSTKYYIRLFDPLNPWSLSFYSISERNAALKNSLFIRAMLTIEISLGHSASHSLSFVQFPKPSPSIIRTISMALFAASGFPWGRRASWEIFALVKSIAEALGHAATQAPHPIHAAASIAFSAISSGIKMVFASGAPPVFTEI